MPDDFEAFKTRVEAAIAERFNEFRLTQANTLRESAASATGQRKDLLLKMADDWEKAVTPSIQPLD